MYDYNLFGWLGYKHKAYLSLNIFFFPRADNLLDIVLSDMILQRTKYLANIYCILKYAISSADFIKSYCSSMFRSIQSLISSFQVSI